MDKFMFTVPEIDAHKSDQKEWYNFVRTREADSIFSLFPGLRFRMGLELGAGDGTQSATISRHCERLICTELDPKSHAWMGQTILQRQMPNVEYRLCDAQDLSQFGDASFDLIFSSNMLEHIPDMHRCLSECRRVLKQGGTMLHTMPSRWWKLFNCGLTLVTRKRPSVHGVSSNHWEEFKAFGRNTWRKRFHQNSIDVTKIVGLPFYVGLGSTFIAVIKAGNIARLPASYLYVCGKRGRQPDP